MIARLLFIAFCSCYASASWAQSSQWFHYIIGVDPVQSDYDLKILLAELDAWDPEGVYKVSLEEHSVDALVHRSGTRDQFDVDLRTAGFHVTRWEVIEPALGSVQTQVPVAGFPKYVDTGDRAADNARYDVAKNLWMEGHPEEYQQLISQPR